MWVVHVNCGSDGAVINIWQSTERMLFLDRIHFITVRKPLLDLNSGMFNRIVSVLAESMALTVDLPALPVADASARLGVRVLPDCFDGPAQTRARTVLARYSSLPACYTCIGSN